MQSKYLNRELSWLSFNQRVLQEAADPRNPLIERMRFLGIFSNNQDEFFKVRVASVKRMLQFDDTSISNQRPYAELLNKIQENVLANQARFHDIYNQIISELAEKNIHIINEQELNEVQGQFVKDYFHTKVYPALVPIMLENLKTFPELRDKTVYFAIKLSQPKTGGANHFALLEIPSRVLPRFLVLPEVDKKKSIIYLDDVIRYCLDEIFAIFEYQKIEAYTIKITRDAELDLDSDISESFLDKMKRGLKKRKKGQPVRFVYDKSISKSLLNLLRTKMDLDEDDNLIPGGRYHNFKDFMKFPNMGGAEMVYKPFQPLQHPLLRPYNSILKVVQEQDVLLHYPYQTFNYLIDLLREAAIDPKVKSIKMTLYRVANESKVINALINAAKNGKEVSVVLELQARFDEENNIYWSNVLQEEGVRVHFGVSGLKVHSKLCLITRKEGNKLIHFVNVGTGNFHEGTAKIYSDFALFTADKRITSEVVKVFKMIEGVYRPFVYRHLVLSPTSLRNKFVRYINREIRNAKQGKSAFITLKLNSLVDEPMIERLYRASQAGVKVRIIVRGACSLLPGVKGMSENIEAISILDRFLEHARVYIFGNAGEPEYFISSADWMTRNLDRRVEVTCPIYAQNLRKEIDDFIDIQWNDNVKSRWINQEQNNVYKSNESAVEVRSQFVLYDYYKGKLKKGEEIYT